MALNIQSFETSVSESADEMRALFAKIEYYITERWASAGYESLYQAVQNDESPGGAITKTQMNNAISAFNAMKTAWENNRAALHVVADLTLPG